VKIYGALAKEVNMIHGIGWPLPKPLTEETLAKELALAHYTFVERFGSVPDKVSVPKNFKLSDFCVEMGLVIDNNSQPPFMFVLGVSAEDKPRV
jgi:hypothetical protein